MKPVVFAAALMAAIPLCQSSLEAKVLRVAPPSPVIDLDPHGPNGTLRDTLLANRQIYDPLVEFNNGAPVGRLATAWQQPDPLTWIFTLRKGVKFHDGQAFTSADAAASIERLVKQKGGFAPLWAALDKVETPDAHTLIVRLKEPVGPFLRNVSLLHIVPASSAKEAGDKYGAAIRLPGTGAFKIKTFRPGQILELEANTSYWDKPPTLTGLVIQNIPELTGRVTALLNNEIDLMWFLPDDQVTALKKNPEITVSVAPSALYYYSWFNPQRKPFDDVRVRQALWHAVDVKRVVTDVLPETGEVAGAPISSAVFGFSHRPQYEYSVEKAKKLLTEAGLPNGFTTELQYSPSQGPELEQLALAFISYWSKIGVKVTPAPLENPVWTKNLRDLNWDMTMASNPSFTEDADYTLGRLYTTKRSGYESPEATKHLIAAQRETDQEKRKQIYSAAIDVLWNDAPGIFPAELKAVYAYRKNISNVDFSATYTPRFRGTEAR
ncbi:ABC transporter substrate-binding protein [Microvirga ossetica]|uniref:ABC transporter substrate-binding protein n=1 Tax=Microvirga ossetica TaxID=1882682 RepID=UPI000C15BEA0|nr:ABC transporter substrate-binding protein [Microvirga ossetica]